MSLFSPSLLIPWQFKFWGLYKVHQAGEEDASYVALHSLSSPLARLNGEGSKMYWTYVRRFLSTLGVQWRKETLEISVEAHSHSPHSSCPSNAHHGHHWASFFFQGVQKLSLSLWFFSKNSRNYGRLWKKLLLGTGEVKLERASESLVRWHRWGSSEWGPIPGLGHVSQQQQQQWGCKIDCRYGQVCKGQQGPQPWPWFDHILIIRLLWIIYLCLHSFILWIDENFDSSTSFSSFIF